MRASPWRAISTYPRAVESKGPAPNARKGQMSPFMGTASSAPPDMTQPRLTPAPSEKDGMRCLPPPSTAGGSVSRDLGGSRCQGHRGAGSASLPFPRPHAPLAFPWTLKTTGSQGHVGRICGGNGGPYWHESSFANSSVDVPTPTTSVCDRVWTRGLYRHEVTELRRLFRHALTQYHYCPHQKRGAGHRHAEGRPREDTQRGRRLQPTREGSGEVSLPRPDLRLPAPRVRRQKCRRAKPPACGAPFYSHEDPYGAQRPALPHSLPPPAS